MAFLWSIVGGAVVVGLVILTLVQFNRMVMLRNRAREAWSNVDTELQRRHELIPNLVAAVQGYAKHERSLLAAVTEARAIAGRMRGPSHAHIKQESRLVALVDRLLAVAEAYPDLKANRNFLQLRNELSLAEDRIQAARRFYNGNVRDYRDATRQFPGILFANLFGFGALEFFQIEGLHMRQAPSVTMRP